MNYRFHNARILAMDKDMQVMNNACLWVEEDAITFIGMNEPDNCPDFDEEIDCKGNLLMPGFKNMHTHSAMTFLRTKADDLPLWDWLTQVVFPAEDKLTKEDIYQLTILAVMEYLTSGITAIGDMYLDPDAIAKACEDTGMRCVQVGGTSGSDKLEERIERMENFYLNLNGKSKLTGYRMGMHAEYTCSREMVEKLSECIHKFKAPISMHLSETKKEVDECIARYGMTPPEFLDSMGIFDFGGAAFHCVHVTESDIEILKKRGMYVVTNPASNTKLASGIAPISDFLKAGVPVAIGTDGAASNNCLDMFREMFLVTGLAKLKENDAAAVVADEVLKMACVNGANAMGLTQSSCLAVGNNADIIMIDLLQPNMQPLHNIVKNIVYSGSKQNVIMTMIAGKILYRNGAFHIGVNQEDVYRNVQNICGRIFGE